MMTTKDVAFAEEADWECVSKNDAVEPCPSAPNRSTTDVVPAVPANQMRTQRRPKNGGGCPHIDKKITDDQMARYRQDFDSDSTGKVAQNALQYTSVHDITIRRDLLQKCLDFTFSIEIDGDGMRATNQKSSGRCWLFAALNVLRMSAATALSVHNFEFSESYHLFFDKLEKANCFLEAIIKTSNEPLDDRTVSLLLDDPIPDGGEWTGAMNLVAKYGLVPKSAFPETYSSSSTGSMNGVLQDLLISSAFEIRSMMLAGGDDDDDAFEDTVRAYKDKRLDDVWRVLAIHLGTPPKQFNWQWRDRDNEFHSCGTMTPLEFSKKFVVDIAWSSYVSLIQDPRNEYYRTYTVDYSQTLLGGFEMKFLNVPCEDMKTITENMLKDGRPLWFACNVGQEFAESQGIWDAELYDIESLYEVKNPRMSKADRIRFGYPMGTHAMLFTGVDLEKDDKPRRWRVENSWGDSGGKDGYYTMNDNWFDINVFEVVVHPQYLTEEMIEGLQTSPIVLPAWDAMGSACRVSKRGRRLDL